MKGPLNEIQIAYLLEHLGHHAGMGEKLLANLNYGPKSGDTSNPGIYFPASEKSLDLEQVIHIEDLPVLYPVSEEKEAFYSFQGDQLIFHHDLLKSAFHLLSGFEEFKNGALDQYGRFPYKESLPFKLGITGKPVVNYYFEIILKGVEEFARKNNLPFNRNPVFKGPVLMLSHDIDRTLGYGFFETGFKFKQLLGLAESTLSRKETIKDAFNSLFHFLNPFSRKDPYWTFETLMKWEEDRNFRGTYYFLEK